MMRIKGEWSRANMAQKENDTKQNSKHLKMQPCNRCWMANPSLALAIYIMFAMCAVVPHQHEMVIFLA